MRILKNIIITVCVVFSLSHSIDANSESATFESYMEASSFCSQLYISCEDIYQLDEGNIQYFVFYTNKYCDPGTKKARTGDDHECKKHGEY